MPRSAGVQMAGNRLQAIFLDRDGTINRERADYVKTWQEYEWLPGALAALALLAKLQVPIFVVTNQSVVGRGILAASALEAIHARLRADVEAAGGRLDGFLTCLHAPSDHCACRKPKPGLLLDAAANHGLVLARCVLVGDSITDMQAAEAAGCGWILVRTGRQAATIDANLASLRADATARGARSAARVHAGQVMDDLRAAAELIAAQNIDHMILR